MDCRLLLSCFKFPVSVFGIKELPRKSRDDFRCRRTCGRRIVTTSARIRLSDYGFA
jgi:hypothetical protein